MSELLDTLVKLASLGASGVCIFAIFWIGWIIYRLPQSVDPERHKSLRLFMLTTLGIAVISGATGITNSLWNERKIADLSTKLVSQIERSSELDRMGSTMKGMVDSLEVVLGEKAIAAEASKSTVLKSHVNILRKSLSRLKPMLKGEDS